MSSYGHFVAVRVSITQGYVRFSLIIKVTARMTVQRKRIQRLWVIMLHTQPTKIFAKKSTAIKMKADVINTDISANSMHCLWH